MKNVMKKIGIERQAYFIGAIWITLLSISLMVCIKSFSVDGSFLKLPDQKKYVAKDIENSLSGIIKVHDNIFLTQNNDPQIILQEINQGVNHISIKIDGLPRSGVTGQVFFAAPKEDFCEENVVTSVLKNGNNIIQLPNKVYGSLRIDIGTIPQLEFNLERIVLNSTNELIKNLLYIVIVFLMLLILLIISQIKIQEDRFKTIRYKCKSIINAIYRYRCIIIILTLFISIFVLRINFSSFKVYGNFLPNNVMQEGTITIGKHRRVRSDEWGVATPIQLGQGNREEKYEGNSELLGEMSQIQTVGIAIPTKDISIIGKPFNWGFLLFGNEIGLSWFYIMRLASLVLGSFLLIEILTNNRKLAIGGAVIIALSPGIQWWNSTGIVEGVIYIQSIVISLYKIFIKNTSKVQMSIASIVLLICTVGFTMILYPPFQIPLFYLGICLLLGIYFQKKENIKFTPLSLSLLGGVIILYTVIMGITVVNMWDDMMKILNTAYPGKRVSVGGVLSPEYLFNYIINLYLPFKDITYLNASEISSWITLFPIPLVIYFGNFKKFSKNIILRMVGLFIFASLGFLFIGVPEIVAKVTLMSMVPEPRLFTVLGFAITLFIVLLLNEKADEISLRTQYIIYAVCIYWYFMRYKYAIEYLGIVVALIITFVLVLAIYFLSYKKKMFLGLMLIITLISGATINPINVGIGTMQDTNISKAIRRINEGDPGQWVTINDNWISKYIMAQGADLFNALNYPPKLEIWRKLDNELRFDEVYNRYAHVEVNIVPNETENKFEIVLLDVFRVNMTIDELAQMGVKYIVTRTPIEGLEILYYDELDGIYIYKNRMQQ